MVPEPAVCEFVSTHLDPELLDDRPEPDEDVPEPEEEVLPEDTLPSFCDPMMDTGGPCVEH